MGRVSGKLPLNAAERDVVVALRDQTPHTWSIVPGVRWAKRNERGYVSDGEADVVVLAPGLGMLVVEVKGSREFRVTESGWQRKDGGAWLTLDRSPVDQATSNAHELKRLLCEEHRWGSTFPGLFAWLVVYPNGELRGVPGLFDPVTLATRREMGGLHAKSRDALASRGSEALGKGFTDGVAEVALRSLTSAEFRIVPADGAKEVTEDKAAIDRLTQQQFGALSGLFSLPSVEVAGPAGSGKTVLAMWHLQSVLEAGRRAIYICYNKRLAESLRGKNPGNEEHIQSIDSYFGKVCPGVTSSPGDLTEFYRSILPNDVFDKVSAWPDTKKFDAVIIDEAQDLSEQQLLALQVFKKDSGTWAVFSDRRQDVYRQSVGAGPAADVLFKLSLNCRNTAAINRATNSCVGSDVRSMPGVPEGVAVTVEKVGRNQMANRAFEIAKGWKEASPNSVAVLSPRSRSESSMASVASGHGITLTEALDEIDSPRKAYFSTIKSFKGIEADGVVLIDAVSPEQGMKFFSMEDLYVGCTRGRTRLAILVSDDDSLTFFKKRLSQP